MSAPPADASVFIARLTGPKAPFELEYTDSGPHFRGGPQSVVDLYRRAVRLGETPLLFIGEAEITYGQVLEPGMALAAALRRRSLQGRRIAIDLEDSVEWLCWFVAITAAGASAVLSPRGAGRDELSACLGAAGCAHIVTRREDAPDGVENLLDLPPSGAAGEIWSLDGAVEALVAFTSGSTGAPKGVRHSHRSLLAGQRNMMLLAAITGRLAPHSVAPTGRPAPPSSLVVAPLHYVAGYSAVLMAMATGGRLALLRDPTSIDEAAALIEHRQLTSLGGAGLDFVRRIIRSPDATVRLRSLRRLQLHGGGLRREICREIGERLPDIQVMTGYGLTETGGALASTPAAGLADGAGGGWLSPAADVRLAPIPHRELEGVGHVEVRGDMVAQGYLDPAQTARAFTADGWFRTGDIGKLDGAGWLAILDRKESGAEASGPSGANLEAAVRGVGGVDEAVVDVVSAGGGLHIVVQPRPGHVVSDEAVRLALSAAGWEGPVKVEMRDVLPSTASGKIDRRRIFA